MCFSSFAFSERSVFVDPASHDHKSPSTVKAVALQCQGTVTKPWTNGILLVHNT